MSRVLPNGDGPGPRLVTQNGAGLTGRLRLSIERRGARSVVTRQEHGGALRILRPLYPERSGQVSLTVINPGGGILGGDDYLTELELAEGASAMVTTQSATKVYRTPQGAARSRVRLRLARNSRLESLPDPIIAYRGAAYRQGVDVDMHESSSLALAEVLTHGWSPDGRPFRYEELFLSAVIRVGGRLAVVDRLILRPGRDGPLALETAGRSHLGTLLVIDPRAGPDVIDAVRAIAEAQGNNGESIIGVSALALPGFALRVLARSTGEAEALIHAVVDWCRAAWCGQSPLDLRRL